jgi:hypothetical protein
MTLALRIMGLLLILVGTLWFFQGINVLPGSFMTGQTKWAVYGAICAGVGLGLWLLSRKSRRGPPPD